MIKRQLTKTLFIASLGLLTTSCGFQLRGEQTIPFATFAVKAPGNLIAPKVKEQVVKNIQHTKLIENTAQADGVLEILNEEQEKVITALSSAGRVREYELRLRVRFTLADKNSNVLIPPTDLKLFRILPYDELQVLGKGEEEALLFRDMEIDIATQILRRVAAATPK